MRWWLALAGTVAAFGGAALASALTTPQHRAEAVIVVGRGGGPLKPGRVNAALTDSVAKLLDSHLIAADAIANLHLHESTASLLRRIHSSAVAPGLVRVRVTDRSALRAEQVAQEITLVFPHLVQARFTGKRALRATVWDPAHAAGSNGRAWGRNFGLAAGVSALLCLLAAAPWRRRGLPIPGPRAEPTPEPSSDKLSQAPGAPEPQPAPAPAPEPVEAPEPQPAAALNGADFNLVELESLVDHARERFPDRVDEWQAYVFFLRDYASADGSLPANFHPLVEDVFADLLSQRR